MNIHRVAGKLRGSQNLALKNQLVRAAMSVPANIVEGSAKGSDREFARFIKIAIGSVSELEYHLIFGNDTGAISQPDFESFLGQIVDVRKMLTGFLKRLGASASISRKAESRPPD